MGGGGKGETGNKYILDILAKQSEAKDDREER